MASLFGWPFFFSYELRTKRLRTANQPQLRIAD
jgi:hypothetical protein